MSSLADTNEESLALLRGEWNLIAAPPDWDGEFTRLTDEWRAVEWRSGGRTLLSALGLQYQEVPLCRGLAWLLDPEGGHRMGRHLVDAFVASLGMTLVEDAPVTIRVEEQRGDTRADIVLRVGKQTVIIEAKVHAGEQPEQADRLSAHFAAETPTLVFLTRTGYLPYSAQISSDQWVARTWRGVAQLARTVSEQHRLDPSSGAREFIETIGAL